MAEERAAAKRRASFGRAGRVAKEAWERAERDAIEQRRVADREKADRQRKAEAVKEADRRVALARKKAEQRRLERHEAAVRREFNRTAEDRKARAAREAAQRQDEIKKAEERQHLAGQDKKRRDADATIARQHKRQQVDQQAEHRRQTDRLRAEHKAQHLGFRHRNAGAIIEHARQIRNIDIAERRELEALGARQRGLIGRATRLVLGAKHASRQEQAIIDRHENARWQKHRDHEARKDQNFWSKQAGRMRQGVERLDMAQRHCQESRELVLAQDRTRPHQIEARVKALEIANDRTPTQERGLERPTDAFAQAAGQGRSR